MNARQLLSKRREASSSAFIDQRIREVEVESERTVFRGKVVGRNPATGEYRVDSGNGNFQWVKSVTSSDIVGKSVIFTKTSNIGQVTEIPGFG